MARIKRGILGGFQGKVANVVGSSWKGIETMRSLPLSVLNPRTAAQVGNRTRFAALSSLAASILTTIVKPLNDRFAQQMSGYNLFTSRNKACFTSVGGFMPDNLILSSGKLGDAVISQVVEDGLNELTVTFPSAPVGAYELGTDKAYCVWLDANGNVLATSSGVVSRSVGTLTMTANVAVGVGYQANVYLSFSRADGTMVSNSAWSLYEV